MTSVTGPSELIALGLAVAVDTAIDSPFLSGDVEASTTIWSQIGSGHDGFGTPGRRWANPAWSGGR